MSSSSLSTTLLNMQQQLIRCVYSLWIVLDFLAASINNIATLLTGVVPVLYSLDHPDLLINSLIFCKIRGYLFQICLMLSRWFVAFACIDRYAQSSTNVRLRNFANKRIAYRSIVGIIIFWSIICSHRLIFYEIKGNLCGIVTNTAASIYHTFYVLVGGGILPSMIMILCTIFLRRNLAFKRQRRQNQNQQNLLDQQVLKLLFIQSFFYILLTTPQMINLIYSSISTTIPNRTSNHLAIDKIIAFIAELMLYIFPVASFYLYTLTARTFQQELIAVLRFIFNRIRRRESIRIAPVNNTITIHHQTSSKPHTDVVHIARKVNNRQLAPTCEVEEEL
ncbi:hypothetical protein I4U23_011597 [Adineta vaga]|nr:hypothetical protein I4U23_011597 [Adineta vaga]